MTKSCKAKILAPAGDKYSFLAAIAAGADAVYCGLKNFSARMEAENFSIEELSRLNALARGKNVQVYVAFNSLVKQNELEKTARVIAKLAKYVRPHALIIQDPGLVQIARMAGFKGELHLSTLGNCSFAAGLECAREAGFSRVVLPRELSIDEIKMAAQNRPEGVDLEVFVHGALCYAVSGRCYWSSWFGGRSGLRGRCVQPCRRIYKQQVIPQSKLQTKHRSQLRLNKQHRKPQTNFQSEGQPEFQPKIQYDAERFFSCLDFSADVLVKVLKDIPEVTTWKIEGRKKSPHYVFYTVRAYQILRDHGHDPAQKKIALSFLDYALGRPSTHYNLLTQNPVNPLKKERDMETGSGLFAGRIKYGGESVKSNTPYFITREALLKDDLLRIGYEDDSFHTIQRVTRDVPKHGRFVLQSSKSSGLKKGSPVFIVDRREKEVWLLINELDTELGKYSSPDIRPQVIDDKLSLNDYEGNLANHTGAKDFGGYQYPERENTHQSYAQKTNFANSYPRKNSYQAETVKESHITLYGYGDESKIKTAVKSGLAGGLWLSQSSLKRCSPKKVKEIWWFLPPVVWPVSEQKLLHTIKDSLVAGARNFVLNMPWQISFFKKIINIESSVGKNKTHIIQQKHVHINQEQDSYTDQQINRQHNNSYMEHLNLWAGPFCNVSNTAHIEFLSHSGFAGAFISPELGQDDCLSIPSKTNFPLGIVIKGNWPLAISRTVSEDISLDKTFSSPRGENAWVSKRDDDYWIFPNWQLDLSHKKDLLKQAGYSLFLTIEEPIQQDIVMKQRQGLWNWEIGLL
ncbi:MAG: U32 family peptidase [Desulfamplus sp.]|nr:U32 family peptidase [Desulfamplus sp.]